MNLSVILPTRNEEFLIKDTLKDIQSFLNKQNLSSYEILVVVNGTNDNTTQIVSEFTKTDKHIKLLKSKEGYGRALKFGLKKAKGNYIAIFNVDFYDLKMIDLIKIDLYGKDFIIGSKMAHWSEDERPNSRKTISYLFNKFLKFVFGFNGSDTHGIKLIRSSVVKKILPKCKTMSGIFDTEFVLRAQESGFKFADFPVRVIEKRPPRFSQRLVQTPIDIYNLYLSLKK